jgi:hypothetical protein
LSVWGELIEPRKEVVKLPLSIVGKRIASPVDSFAARMIFNTMKLVESSLCGLSKTLINISRANSVECIDDGILQCYLFLQTVVLGNNLAGLLLQDRYSLVLGVVTATELNDTLFQSKIVGNGC